MTWLVEDPLPILIVGVVLEVILGLILAQSGRGILLLPMAFVAVIVVVLVVVEQFIVTQTELIQNRIYGAAIAVESNDVDAVFQFVDPASESMRDDIRNNLARYKIDDIVVRDLKIRVNELTSPPSASAEFVARGRVSDKRTKTDNLTFLQRFVIKLRREDYGWVMHSYERHFYGQE